MKIKLDSAKKIITQEEQSIITDELTINRIVDIPQQNNVLVFIERLPNPVILWAGDDYDIEGTWTHQSILQGLKDFFNAAQ